MSSDTAALLSVMLMIILALIGGVVWILDIQSDVNETLRADSVWKAQVEGELDENRRWMCQWQHASHLACPN